MVRVGVIGCGYWGLTSSDVFPKQKARLWRELATCGLCSLPIA
jgi:hypothetical protein